VGTCTTTTTFSSGLFVGGTATSSNLSLGPTKCTELAYAIETSGATLNKTYRLRLVTGSTTSQLDAYTQYPTFTIESAQDIRYSKEVRGGYSTTTLDSLGDVGQFASIAIGTDGFPVISYYEGTNGNLSFAKCNNSSCSSYATSFLDTQVVSLYTFVAIGSDGFPVISYYDNVKLKLDVAHCNNITCASVSTTSLSGVGSGAGQYSSIAIGTDGFPVISYYNATSSVQDLQFGKCNDVFCSSVATSSLDTGGAVGKFSSITIGSDGFPVISYYDETLGNLNFAKCNNSSCSSYATSSLDTGGNVGWNTSVTVGADGFPVISYYDATNFNLNFAKCNNISCSSVTTSSLDTGGDTGQYTSIAIGSDGFPAISYYDVTNGNLSFAKCNNSSCSSYATSSLDTGGNVGSFTSHAIGSDGFPVIAYRDNTLNNLNFAKCNSISCVSAASTTLGNLGSTNSDLSQHLDDAAYTNVATSDNLYDTLAAGTSTRLAYVFTMKNSNNTDTITPIWEGQVSKATTTFLKIYNNSTGAWEVLDSDTAPTPNTDFTLTGTQSANIANYYDGSNVIYLRVETGTTTASTTLKTDQITVNAAVPDATLLHYRWRHDNGSESSALFAANEDIPLTATSSTYKGDRRRLRILVSNAGASSANNYNYRLEYASSSCTSWTQVPTSALLANEEWVMDLSQYILDGSPTTNSSSLTDPGGKSFVAGESRVFANQTGATSITTTQFSEYEYSIRSTVNATAGLLYCFRLTNAGSITNFTYTVQPQITLTGGLHPQAGQGSSETNGSGAVHAGGALEGGNNSEGSGSGTVQTGGGAGGGGGDSG
jgi:putative component of membrane protein insertase Oxa1/YidC/SpoIIIJ protein YidD